LADLDRDANDNAGAVPDPQAGQVTPVPAAPLSAKGVSRRRFTRAGASAAGVLMTLHSAPGMATSSNCGMSPSAALSAKTGTAVSNRGGTGLSCSGQGPVWWAWRLSWPTGCDSNGDFKNFFSCQSRGASYAKVNPRLLVGGLVAGDAANGNIGRYVLAAYLNAAAGYTSFLTTTMVQQIWNEWSLQGYYEPVAGKKWYVGDIVDYLAGTMATS